ncbi:BZ3500_MvSof-1268-A1-R1_Chr9g10615 [Microbotryum saponariae]|uniref:BZ3500_MvSof-1268-A1-R1_Chr9g10615 protein n=1 Tax=Microbotryum saponariae TaxID=289078 RepID=A0A2X0N0F7_9BASI|nr:BZ3501_MvSof-1269-A2-R1_Chr9g10363 [Microbotryum saponariae]SDA00392.1 BZ3500_MvSof-1268-A1-R1_Chr9g10615 [Microbotryum saponariae]
MTANETGQLPTQDAALIPPLLFFAIPVFMISIRVRNYLKGSSGANTYDPKTGLGKGAPGFTTAGTRKVALPAHLVARIKSGEDVSAEEVTEALELEEERLRREAQDALEAEQRAKKGIKTMKVPENVDSSWLPAGSTIVGGSGGARRRKK